jgi:predicted nuclease of restriction endonuclease-like RecB superfamily
VFVTRELLYTAITRPKEKLHIVVNKKLENELSKILQEAYFRSAVAGHDTLLFGHKTQYKRPFKLTLKDGAVVAFASKIEYMIGDVLDKADIHFEYECSDFLDKYHFLPDFKFKINGKCYYLEHLGNINIRYSNRWNWKKDVYIKLCYGDNLITTSEKEDSSNVNDTIKQIIEDIKCNRLRKSIGSYSNHHYEL